MPMDLDKAREVIYGLAIGDALARPTEFLSLSAITQEYGLECNNDLLRADGVLATLKERVTSNQTADKSRGQTRVA